jgi:hypothetical protein
MDQYAPVLAATSRPGGTYLRTEETIMLRTRVTLRHFAVAFGLLLAFGFLAACDGGSPTGVSDDPNCVVIDGVVVCD